MKSLAQQWKDYFASFGKYSPTDEVLENPDGEEPEEENLIEVEIETTKSRKPRESKAARTQRLMCELLVRRAEEAETTRRAQNIQQLDRTKYIIKKGSIEDYIHTTLSKLNAAKHISTIINEIEVLGWKSESKYHKYAAVSKALHNSSYMFRSVGNGSFKLRDAFRGLIIPKGQQITKTLPKDNTIPTLKDIIIDIAKEHQDKGGMYPGRVYDLMRKTGYRCAYSSVYRAMQTAPFIRNGFFYRIEGK
jgi:hypothetical protein